MRNERRSTSRSKVRVFFILEIIISVMLVYVLSLMSLPTGILIGAFVFLMFSPFNRFTEKCSFITANFVINSERNFRKV